MQRAEFDRNEENNKKGISQFRLKGVAELIDRALYLISVMLPQRVVREEWEACLKEFMDCDDSLCDFLEKGARGKMPSDPYAIHQMLGLSKNTLKHCYELGEELYRRQDFDEARCLFGFLASIAPYMPECWISLGMCYNKMGKIKDAIATYALAQEIFKEEPSLPIYCAANYIALGDHLPARIELSKVEKIFARYPKVKNHWGKMHGHLRSRCFA